METRISTGDNAPTFSLRRDGGRTLLLNGAALGANLCSGLVLARSLGPGGRGAVAAVVAAPQLIGWLFTMGAGQAIPYFRARGRYAPNALLSTWLTTIVVPVLVAIAAAEIAVPMMLHAQSPATLRIARLYMLTVALVPLNEVGYGVLLGDHDYLAYNVIRSSQHFIIAGAYVLLYRVGLLRPASAVATMGAVFTLASAIALTRAIRRHGLVRPSIQCARESVWYGLRAHGTNVGGILNSRLDIAIIPAVLVASQVGYYSVATNVSWLVVTLAGALAPLVLPAAARKDADTERTVKRALFATLVVGSAAALVVGLVAAKCIPLVYGARFDAAVLPLRILLVGAVAFAGANVVASGLYALNRPLTATVTQFGGLVITVAGLALFLRKDGILAAAWISTLSYVLVFFAALVAFQRAVTERPSGYWSPWFSWAQRALSKGMLPWITTAVAAIAAAAVCVYGSAGFAAVPVGFLVAAAFILPVGIGLLTLPPFLRTLRSDGSLSRIGVLVLSAVVVVAVAVPSAQLTTGGRPLKTSRYNVTFPHTGREVHWAVGLLLLAFLLFAAGQEVAVRTSRRRLPPRVQSPSRSQFLVLALLGVGVSVASPLSATQALLGARGAVQGQGLVTLLRWALPLAIATGILCRHFGSKKLVVVSVFLGAVLSTWGTRSPLMLIVAAVVMRLVGLLMRRRVGARVLVAAGILCYVVVVLLIAIAQWRGSIIYGTPQSFGRTLDVAAQAPLATFDHAGVDTVDGAVLAHHVDRKVVGATPLDLTKAVTGFIPHQLWPSKPDWLTVTVARDYLHWSASGMFLSGAGYLFLVGGYPLLCAFFLALGYGLERLFAATTPTRFRGLLATYFLTRFFVAGDAFDIFEVIGLTALAFIAYHVPLRVSRALRQGVPIGTAEVA